MKATDELDAKGYAILQDVFAPDELKQMIDVIDAAEGYGPSFRKTKDLFAIRRFLQEIPGIVPCLFTGKFKKLIADHAPAGAFVTKSIYFDKPELSNWFVAYHQDLTISVDRKTDIPGFGPWTVKQDQFAVQPPLSILEQNLTLRLHLDDTGEHTGALKVIRGSHKKGIYRPEHIDRTKEQEDTCCVARGGVMLMKPLLLHASARSTGAQRRRVIHLEFSNAGLPAGLNWSEKLNFRTA